MNLGEMIRLENNELQVDIAKKGAELTRIYNKSFGIDYLWSGDSTYWGRTSPVLFPIVGKLKNNHYTYKNRTYSMSGHGFARDMDFEVIHYEKEKVCFLLKWTSETLEHYPFYFELCISYELIGQSIKVLWNVRNCGEGQLYFSIGGHPAFHVPLTENTCLNDYYLQFEGKENNHLYLVNCTTGLITSKEENLLPVEQFISPQQFKNDAVIYDGVKGIKIYSTEHNHSIHLQFDDFPYVGIWSPYNEVSQNIAPFVCIEPWHGIADYEHTTSKLEEKQGIKKLGSKEEFSTFYTISLK